MKLFFSARVVSQTCRLYVVATAALLCGTAFGLDPGKAITQYVQSAWNSESGLPQNSVHAIAQTTDGSIWLGTEEGLARFDGVQFTIYTSQNSHGLPSDYIQCLAAGPDGDLWIGTDSGLSHWIPSRTGVSQGEFRIVTAKDGLAGDSITALLEAGGDLWVGAATGISRISGGRIVQHPAPAGLPGIYIRAIAAGPDGEVWIGTDSGLFNLSHGNLRHWTRRDGLPAEAVTSLAPAPDGTLWLGTAGGGIAELREGRIAVPPVHLPWNEIDGILRDRNGALWIAFDRHGIGRLYQGRLAAYDASNGLPSNRCTRALFEDREGSLWIGLLDAGVAQLRDGKFTVFGKPEGLAGNYIGDILQTHDGSVWIASDSNGLNRLLPDGHVEIWDRSKGLPEAAIYSMVETRDGALWLGYRNGELARIQGRTVAVFRDPETPRSSLNSLFEDREGNIWLGYFGGGVARFEHGHYRQILKTGRVPAIAQTPDGAMWFGDDGDGVTRWLPSGSTHFSTANGLPSDHVMCLYVDSAGEVWVGTASGGLTRIRNGQIISWTTEQGLPGSTVGSITEDNQGNLWLGGDYGIARISGTELASSTPQFLYPVVYGVSDGLRSRETVYGGTPSTWKDNRGRLWFATIMGAAVVDPAHIEPNPIIPPVWIESVSFDSRAIAVEPRIELGAGGGNIHFSYSAPSFVAPAHMRFRYRLAGFDSDWVEAGSRHDAWYTNLPPGRYSFQVQAANSDGIWNLKGASLNLILSPPLRRTPLAYVVYALACIALVWGIVVLRTRRLVRNRAELNRIVAERTAQLEAEKVALEQVRRELHTRATHDSLTGIFNRAAILDHLQREIARAAREKAPLGVIIADLDHFKPVNDTYGHLVGDEVIRESASRFRQVMRAYDIVGRYGGEEFLILLPGWEPSAAPNRIEMLLDSIRSEPFQVNGHRISLTCSFGVAAFIPADGSASIPELLSRADTALYAAKNGGRNRASIAT